MTRANKVFGRKKMSASADTTNNEGMPAWTPTPEAQLVQTLLTNTFGNTYYVKQRDLVEQSEKVHDAALAADPEFYAKALVFARNKGYMRTQPVYGTVRLAEANSPHFAEVFSETIRTPHDLNDFLVIYRSRRGNLGGRRLKRVVGSWLAQKLNEYWVIKYGAGTKGDGFSLRDMVQLTHPKVGEQRALFDYVLRNGFDSGQVRRQWGSKDAPSTETRDVTGLSQIMAFEALKVATSEEEKVKAIKDGRLPHEVVTPFIKTKAEWNALVPNLPIFALLKNLATLERHGVLNENKALISKKLSDPQVIGKSRILPFRFVEAEQHVDASWVKDALRDATELAFDNVPTIEGETEILLDVSPSMQPSYSNFIKQAAPMAVAVAKKAGAGIVAFGGEAKRFSVSQRDSLLTQAKQFVFDGNHWGRGRIHTETWTHGTNPAAAMDILIKERAKADNLIILTDGEQNQGRPFSDAFADYLHKVNRKVRLFVIDVSPYNKAMVPINAPGCYYIYGWSDQVLQFISLTAAQDSMVKAIKDWDWKAKIAA